MKSASRHLRALRKAMKRAELDGYIVEDLDPHQSEYPPAFWRRRSWLSGFGGSAGTAVVTQEKAGLWTDSRYYLEAEEALEGSDIVLFRDGEIGTPSIVEWLGEALPRGSVVGLAAETTSFARVGELSDKLLTHELSVRTLPDILLSLWTKRPERQASEIWLVSPDITGQERGERIGRLQRWLRDRNTDGVLLATLDDIAWLLNVRGWDVPYNPVILAFLIVEKNGAILFADTRETTECIVAVEELARSGLEVRPYESVYDFVTRLPEDYRLAADPELLPYRIKSLFPGTLRREHQPTRLWKAEKTPEEIEGMAECAIRDGTALTRFFMWLEERLGEGKKVRESDCQKMLRDMKSQDPDYLGESFESISAAGPHGAIIHYRVTHESDAVLSPGNLYLLDQGSHYRFGTTDATRVEAIGSAGELERADYTEVLKAHIALATARFPAGTKGEQLDSIARDVLWRSGRNYGHGTGHGVGFLLNVHEGPCRIAPKCSDVALSPGMVLSNEPGVYRPGRYGIRIENLVTVVEENGPPAEHNDFGPFLALRTLGLAPLDPRLIDRRRLSEGEQRWLQLYFNDLVEALGPRLEPTERSWLEARCRL